MLLYEDYFSSGSSPTSSTIFYSPMLDGTVYDIILLSPAHTKNCIKDQYITTLHWLDTKIVSSY